MPTAKQLGFQILESKSAKFFGGAYLGNSNPKTARPISTKRSMHLVIRASMAKGNLSLLKKEKEIQRIISKQAKSFGIKVYRSANGGNHLHMIVLPRSRSSFHGFVRSITGLIARLILGAEKANPRGLKFWDKRPFTRVIEWGREFNAVNNYLVQNLLEAYGFVPYEPRKGRHKLAESTSVPSTAPS
jgi:hypothetical protein